MQEKTTGLGANQKSINKEEALNRLSKLEEEAKALRDILENEETTKVGSILGKEANCILIYEKANFNVAGVKPKEILGNNYFSTQQEAESWAEAIDTLIALRRQEGSCKLENNIKQYVIASSKYLKVIVEASFDTDNKLDLSSPCFISEEYALQAIKNIGEDKLLRMFNTLHGITN